MGNVKVSKTPRISSNPFPVMSVHGGGTGWKIRYVDVHQYYSKKPPVEGEYDFKLTELTSQRFEFKDEAVSYMETLELLKHTPGASLVYDDVIKYAFTEVRKETFQVPPTHDCEETSYIDDVVKERFD